MLQIKPDTDLYLMAALLHEIDRAGLFNASVIAELGSGTRLENLGCEQRGQTLWCRVRTICSISATGWVNGRYLRDG